MHGGDCNLKNIIVSIPNTLLSGGLSMYLKKECEFHILQEDRLEQLMGTCMAVNADVLLAEVRHYPPHTVADWLDRSFELKRKLPCCKIAFLVDENSNPLVAEEVKEAKLEGHIDAFFYGTVSGEYVAAVISSL
jgi:hypothetical protein